MHRDAKIGLYTAVLGGKIRVESPKGQVTVTIPAGTQNGKVLRLRGLGMPVYGKKNECGNLLVKIEGLLPEKLNQEEVDLFKKLAALRK